MERLRTADRGKGPAWIINAPTLNSKDKRWQSLEGRSKVSLGLRIGWISNGLDSMARKRPAMQRHGEARLSNECTDSQRRYYAERGTAMAERRTALAERRTALAERRTALAKHGNGLAAIGCANHKEVNMGFYTGNPLRDADHYGRQQQKWLDSLPRCAGCGEPIQDQVWYEVGRHKYCLECEDVVWSKVKGEYLSV